MPSSKTILYALSEAVVSSSLKGISEYHQVLIAEPNIHILVREKLGPHTRCLQSLNGRVDNLPVNI